MSETHCISLDDVLEAHQRIVDHVVRTPVIGSEDLSAELGVDVVFKCENLQHVGAFKARGACNAVFALGDADAASGVLAHSSGNHAAALARAAKLRGVKAHIVMPENSAAVKIAAVRRLGVEPVFCGPGSDERQAAADEVQARTGATLVHPYDNPLVMAGQGTTAVEILEQAPEIDTLVIPVGGGGLLSGSLIAVRSLRPEVRVVAVEPAWADDTNRSHLNGQIELPVRYDTVADGLRTRVGELTFPIIHDLVDEILTVSEATIVEATRQIHRQLRVVAEPSGAVPLGVILEHRERFRGRRVAAVISGGNLDLSAFPLN